MMLSSEFMILISTKEETMGMGTVMDMKVIMMKIHLDIAMVAQMRI